jgi:hypothetical protein
MMMFMWFLFRRPSDHNLIESRDTEEEDHQEIRVTNKWNHKDGTRSLVMRKAIVVVDHASLSVSDYQTSVTCLQFRCLASSKREWLKDSRHVTFLFSFPFDSVISTDYFTLDSFWVHSISWLVFSSVNHIHYSFLQFFISYHDIDALIKKSSHASWKTSR